MFQEASEIICKWCCLNKSFKEWIENWSVMWKSIFEQRFIMFKQQCNSSIKTQYSLNWYKSMIEPKTLKQRSFSHGLQLDRVYLNEKCYPPGCFVKLGKYYFMAVANDVAAENEIRIHRTAAALANKSWNKNVCVQIQRLSSIPLIKKIEIEVFHNSSLLEFTLDHGKQIIEFFSQVIIYRHLKYSLQMGTHFVEARIKAMVPNNYVCGVAITGTQFTISSIRK